MKCLKAGRPADVSPYLKCACYYGESAKNMHCRAKEHVSKFNSKSEKIRAESAFYKHVLNTHGGISDSETFADYFEIQILKAYKKPFTRLVEEGTFITSHKGELLNSKNEWHQAKIVRTTTHVIQGGAGMLQGEGGGGSHGGGGGGGGHGGGGGRGGRGDLGVRGGRGGRGHLGGRGGGGRGGGGDPGGRGGGGRAGRGDQSLGRTQGQ